MGFQHEFVLVEGYGGARELLGQGVSLEIFDYGIDNLLPSQDMRRSNCYLHVVSPVVVRVKCSRFEIGRAHV